MASKRLKIENLENLHELNAEELSFIQGGLSGETPELETSELYIESEKLIDPDHLILQPYPLPDQPTYPNKPLPYYPCSLYPTKDGLPWCAVIL